jgi:lipoprotein-anchoring transpeptidase ErfK/SrfK
VTARTAAASGALLAVGAVVVGAVLHHGSAAPNAVTPSASFASQAKRLPPPEKPAFRVGRPTLLSRRETPARYASVAREVLARSAPTAAARPVTTLALATPEGTTNIVLVVGERKQPGGLWVRVRVAALPNGLTGWVRRSVLGGYHFVHTRLVIDRTRLTATLSRDGRRIFQASIGVGRPEWPTPAGQFYIRDRLSGFGDPFYGPVAFGTSARSAVLTDWPEGGFVGIHGTNEPELIPGHISHGCIRLRNSDILRLSRLMPVGTPVTIR